MTENAYTSAYGQADNLADRATWAVNSLIEAGEDDLAADLVATYAAELRELPRRRPRPLRNLRDLRRAS